MRRELSINYTNYEPRYDEYAALPEWARKTLREHAHDDYQLLRDAAHFQFFAFAVRGRGRLAGGGQERERI